MERTLDRIYEHDPRSLANYNIRTLLDLTKQPRSYTWGCDTYNDQGQEGACVGFSWSHELAAKPKIVPTNAQMARDIYYRARQLDSWPGEDYDGTSVLAGAKAVMELKNSVGVPLLKEYRWAESVNDLILAVGYKGPAVLGLDWYTGMWYPGENGFVSVSGEVAGGHAILCNGFKFVKKNTALPITWENMDRYKSYFILHNSWGYDWGWGGRCKVRVEGMEKLFAGYGEGCIPVVRSYA